MNILVALLCSFSAFLAQAFGQDSVNDKKVQIGLEYRIMIGTASNPIFSVTTPDRHAALYSRLLNVYTGEFSYNSMSLGLTLNRGKSSIVTGPTLDRVSGHDTNTGLNGQSGGPINLDVEHASRGGFFGEYRYWIVPRKYYDEGFFLHLGYSNRHYNIRGSSGTTAFDEARLGKTTNHTLYSGFGFYYWRVGVQGMIGESLHQISNPTRDFVVSNRRPAIFVGFGALFRIK